jgi:SEC-C motif
VIPEDPALSASGEPPNGSPLFYYPQFEEIEVPPGSSAVRGWRGLVQPFDGDQSARHLLRALARNQKITVDAGTLQDDHSFSEFSVHALESRIRGMNEVFDIVALEMDGSWHPRTYSLGPEISRRVYPDHPHLRDDLAVHFGARKLDGLCIYSAAEFEYNLSTPRMVQFLGQTAIYLAKHLIWLRTRQLVDLRTGEIVFHGAPGENIFQSMDPSDVFRRTTPDRTKWIGLWPGKVAKQGRQHLDLPKTGECWCGSGRTYESCCWNREATIQNSVQ